MKHRNATPPSTHHVGSAHPMRTIGGLISSAPFRDVGAFLLLTLLNALMDGFGVAILVPLVDLLMGRQFLLPFHFHGFADAVKSSNMLGVVLILLVIISTLRVGLRHLVDITSQRLQFSIVDRLREDCFNGLIRAEWNWLSQQQASDHTALLINNIGRIGTGLTSALGLLVTITTVAVYGVLALWLSWRIALLALVTGGALFILSFPIRREILAVGSALGSTNRAIQARVQESFAAVRLVKIHRNESRQISAFSAAIAQVRTLQYRYLRVMSLGQGVQQIGGAIALGILLYISEVWWQVAPAILFALLMLMVRVMPMMAGIQQGWYLWLHALPALIETKHVLGQTQQHAERLDDDGPPVALNAGIRLDRVTFRYANRDAVALDAVSLDIRARTTTAIVGQSGAGKSTLADILMGILVPSSGTMLIDGTDAQLLRSRWRGAVAYVQQDVFLFHDTIRANLLWAAPDADDATLHAVLKQAAADFVHNLPDGLDTIVGDGGLRLSGGERQRVALARALLCRPSLLILDEATSALDLANEAAIRQAIDALHGQLTVVIIGHRLAMIDQADQIVTVDHGAITTMQRTRNTFPTEAARV